jgi:hypothetical protein
VVNNQTKQYLYTLFSSKKYSVLLASLNNQKKKQF